MSAQSLFVRGGLQSRPPILPIALSGRLERSTLPKPGPQAIAPLPEEVRL